ncbi:MAG TPA: hypothetical protein VF588_17585 [Pyrinomonadaceae bacterium]|jgi:hypothetical protein
MAHQFEVKAKENSVSGGAPLVTGISVTKGELLTVSVPADDTWSAGAANRTSNANGLGNPLGDDFGVFTHGPFSFLYGSLVGSLDGGKTFFAVGTRMEMSIIIPSGRLTLYYWDVNKDDNSGSVTATVEVYKGPRM